MFPSILIQLENGLNGFFFQLNDNISPGAVTGGNLINLAAVEKTKRKKHIRITVLFWHESEGNKKIKLKTIYFIVLFFNFKNVGSGR